VEREKRINEEHGLFLYQIRYRWVGREKNWLNERGTGLTNIYPLFSLALSLSSFPLFLKYVAALI